MGFIFPRWKFSLNRPYREKRENYPHAKISTFTVPVSHWPRAERCAVSFPTLQPHTAPWWGPLHRSSACGGREPRTDRSGESTSDTCHSAASGGWRSPPGAGSHGAAPDCDIIEIFSFIITDPSGESTSDTCHSAASGGWRSPPGAGSHDEAPDWGIIEILYIGNFLVWV